jgi:hypothetical protein
MGELYNEYNNIWGLPQEYKNIKFYPIKLKDVEYIDLLYELFARPKNYIPDVAILKMSYLKYLLFVVKEISTDGEKIYQNLVQFLQYSVKTDVKINISLIAEEISIANIKIEIVIDNVIFSEYDFEKIREIILNQNGLDINYVEAFNPELEKKLDILLSLNKDTRGLTLKDEVFIFCALVNKLATDIQDYTLYQFKAHFERITLLNEFNLYKPLEASGQIKLENGGKIRHYMSNIENKGRYGNLLIAKDEYLSNNKEILS